MVWPSQLYVVNKPLFLNKTHFASAGDHITCQQYESMQKFAMEGILTKYRTRGKITVKELENIVKLNDSGF